MKRISLSSVFAKAHANMANRRLNAPVFRRQRGASAIEYVTIAAVIALAIYAASTVGGIDIKGAFENFFTAVNDAVTT